MHIFWIIFTIIFITTINANAATVTEITSSADMAFGKVGTIDDNGLIKSNCNVTGVVSFDNGCQSGVFTIKSKKNGNNDGGKSIRIFIEPRVENMIHTNGSNLVKSNFKFSPKPSNCSLSGSNAILTCTATSNGSNTTWSPITVWGRARKIDKDQEPGKYSRNYDLIACACDSGNDLSVACPDDVSDARCEDSNGAKSSNKTVEITIAQILQITSGNKTALNFGKIAAGTALATMGYSGSVTNGGDAVRISNGAPGWFKVTGESGENYQIILPSSVSLVCDGSPCNVGVDNMSATLDFLSSGSSISSGSTRILTGGFDEIDVEGVLSIGANQPEGKYSGVYPITITYQ